MARAYEKTAVSVAKSRDDISRVLTRWGVSGVSWADDFEAGVAILRFKWRSEEDVQFVARFMLKLETDEELREASVDGRSGRFSTRKFDVNQQNRGKREHRLLSMFLKNTFEAVEEGIIIAEQVFLPWLEDAEGVTVAERLGPMLGRLPETTLPKMLAEAKKR